MQKFLTIIILLALGYSAFAQNNYIDYYNLVRKAGHYKREKKYDSASVAYQQAFSKVDYVHVANLKAAAKVSSKNKDKAQANKYNELAYKQEQAINTDLKKILDSLCKEDQRIRGKDYINARNVYFKCSKDSMCDKTTETFINAETLLREWWKTDSSNIAMLKQIIVEYGFPSEKLVGFSTAESSSIIILHYDQDQDNSIMKPILDSALYNGDISPENYAWVVDRRLSWGQGKAPYYYHMPMGLGKLTDEEIKEIDARRYKIGLGGVYDNRVITVTKKGIRVRYIYD